MGCRARCWWREHRFIRSLMVLPRGCAGSTTRRGDALLFVGDDWAETHHDVELMDTAGRRLAKARVPEGVAGMARLHVMIVEQLGEDIDEAQVAVGIEDRPGSVGTGVDRRRLHGV